MAIKTSNSATTSTITDWADKKYFMGVIPYKVVAINPTLKDLHDLGQTHLKNEPVYAREWEKDNVKHENIVIDFWLQSQPVEDFPDLDILVKRRFELSDVPMIASTGKVVFINKYGRVTWYKDRDYDLEGDKYFVNDGVRIAHRGEEFLYKFLFAWLNMTYDTVNKKYDECIFNIDKLVKKDYSEVLSLREGTQENTIKCLTGVKIVEADGKIKKYHEIYDKYFLKHNQNSTEKMDEFITKSEDNAFKVYNADLEYSYEIKEFSKNVKPDVDPIPNNDNLTAEQIF